MLGELSREAVTEVVGANLGGALGLEAGGERGVIVDSFDRTSVIQIERHSTAQTGMDLPQSTPRNEWLQYLSDQGIEWVYVRHDFATQALIARAHDLGLKVMAYTIDDGRYPPAVDGVITNVAPGGW